MREKAAVALGLIGDAAAAEALEKALEDTNGFVRIAAAEALNGMGLDKGKAFLVKVLSAPEKDARLRAMAVLEKISKRNEIAQFKKLLTDTDKSIAVLAAKAIVTIESKE
ncbi:MAG: hypothetical protein A2314_04385 [Elusimicrobia bacterium RIFOXYB2_FULL_50_12]|nr:MAG: hypothetical protein A2314_04385 [Elusimicrobia bacterium RIFOXYB2_FULL_50_12]